MDIPVSSITAGNRKRQLNPAKVAELAHSISEIGLLNPITVARVNSHYELVAGAHRLEAYRMLQRETIPAQVFEGDDLHAELAEIDENLKRNDLTVLEQGEHLRRRNEILEELGQRAKASPGTNQYTEVGENISPTKTTAQVAAESGLSERSAQQRQQVIKNLLPEVVEIIRDHPIADTLTQLLQLCKLKGERQIWVAELVVSGEAKNVEAAISLLKKAARAEREEKAAQATQAAAAPVERIKKTVNYGEWWRLGNHLLYCGDTSQPEFINALPAAAFAFADPPYGANVAEWDSAFYWEHDYLIDKADVVAVTPGIVSIFEFARLTTMPYLWSVACWLNNGMTRGPMGYGNWIYAAMFSRGSLYRQAQDFYQTSISGSQTEETDHKGRKPSGFVAYLVSLFSKTNDVVIDPFLGSGTTLFVCDELGRTCIGGEKSPEYCTDIVARWEQKTGKEAELIGNYVHDLRKEERGFFQPSARGSTAADIPASFRLSL